MANLNMLYRYEGVFDSFVLLSEHSLAFLLPAGTNVIEPDPNVEIGSCGLIPLGGVCERVRTTGLKWNLAGEQLRFGDLVRWKHATQRNTRGGCSRCERSPVPPNENQTQKGGCVESSRASSLTPPQCPLSLAWAPPSSCASTTLPVSAFVLR